MYGAQSMASANSAPPFRSNGNIYSDQCASLTGWTDGDTGTGTTTQVSFGGRSTFKMDGGTAAAGNFAAQSRDVGTFGNRVVVTVILYNDLIGTLANTDQLRLLVDSAGARAAFSFASDGLYAFDGSTNNEVGTNIVDLDAWTEWTFDIDFTTPASASCTVYKNGVSQATGVDVSQTGTLTNGTITFQQFGENTANTISYVDRIIIGDGFA